MGVKRPAAAAVAAVLSAIVLTGGAPARAAAFAPDCSSSPSPSAVAGVPRLDAGRGAIELRIGSDARVLTRSALGLGTRVPGDRFGAAVAGPFDADGDNCGDFVVAAPGAEGTGVVYMLRGSPGGIEGAYPVRLPAARPGDRFGHSLSVGYSPRPLVVVGAPGRDVGRTPDAGAIAWFRPSANGPGPVRALSQASPGVAGAPEADDRFGEVLGPSFDQRETALDVIVGVPREDVGRVPDAGIVEQVSLIGDGRGPVSRIYRQRAGGPLGVPEPGDRFGAALAIGDDLFSNTLAVGVPGEDVGTARDAGAVNLLTDEWTFPDDVHYQPRRAVTQRSARVPGTVEAGDRFGASLATTNYCVFERDDDSGSLSADFAIGAPGEDLGPHTNAGTVTLYDTGLEGDGRRVTACRSHLIRQDGLAVGRAETGDQLGADVGTRLFSSELVVAVPGEDVGTVADAGLVGVVDLGRIEQRPAEQFSGGPRAGLRYAILP